MDSCCRLLLHGDRDFVMIKLIDRTFYVASRTLQYGWKLAVREMPDRLRFEIERFNEEVTHVEDTISTVRPKRYVWNCPNPNYDWHYSVDDLGWYDTWQEAYEAGEAHWRKWHQGVWPG
jgi:hypothetical protein